MKTFPLSPRVPWRRSATTGALCLLALSFSIAAAGKPASGPGITIYGRPMLVVSSAAVMPRPGMENRYPRVFDLKLAVSNIGSIVATHILATLPPDEYVSAENGSAVFGFNYIYAGSSAETTLHMVLDRADPAGRVQPVFHFEYYEYNEKDDTTIKYTSDEPVPLSFGDPGWNHPALIISSAVTAPANPAPGKSCILTIRLSNVSTGIARNVFVRLGGTDGPKPFATIGGSNVGYTEQVPAQQTAEVTFPLIVDGETVPGAYPIQVSLSYQNVLGEDSTDNQVVYLKVRTQPNLQADLIDPLPEILLVGQSFDLPVEVINIGRQSLNVSTVELTSDDLTLTSASIYSGPLDGGTSTSLSATAVAEKAGPARVTVVVHYLDEFNQPQTWTRAFNLSIQEQPSPASQAADNGGKSTSILEAIWKAILAFLGFGG